MDRDAVVLLAALLCGIYFPLIRRERERISTSHIRRGRRIPAGIAPIWTVDLLKVVHGKNNGRADILRMLQEVKSFSMKKKLCISEATPNPVSGNAYPFRSHEHALLFKELVCRRLAIAWNGTHFWRCGITCFVSVWLVVIGQMRTVAEIEAANDL